MMIGKLERNTQKLKQNKRQRMICFILGKENDNGD